ncbi:hypothetical protein [Herpetosiphon giganteus]|uniref:hypothetical protein n=1 Tax=Herpetosiphon giganteus TaxID=2029754 RepID=UPI00195C829F|nr:hypothetical protein [Herpetosiphon giganteus]MBM7846639.1 hypothetical protein [Herpetosiphon giganteus]
MTSKRLHTATLPSTRHPGYDKTCQNGEDSRPYPSLGSPTDSVGRSIVGQALVVRMATATCERRFSPRADLQAKNSTTNPRDTQKFQMFRFKANNLYRRHEDFYRNFKRYMRDRFSISNANAIAEIAEFDECWNTTNFEGLRTF